MLRSKVEKMAIFCLGISVLGVAAWWWFSDFSNAGVSAYLPFLIPPILGLIFLVSRERRLEAQVALWDSTMKPFPNRDCPDTFVDPKRHGIGWMEVHGGVKLGTVLSLPSEDGIFLQMAMNASRFHDKFIPWDEIARLTYLKTGMHRDFATASLGFAAVQFTTPRNLKMVIPWRETFVTQIPDRLGFQEVRQSATGSK
jgi:hypothetical protein